MNYRKIEQMLRALIVVVRTMPAQPSAPAFLQVAYDRQGRHFEGHAADDACAAGARGAEGRSRMRGTKGRQRGQSV